MLVPLAYRLNTAAPMAVGTPPRFRPSPPITTPFSKTLDGSLTFLACHDLEGHALSTAPPTPTPIGAPDPTNIPLDSGPQVPAPVPPPDNQRPSELTTIRLFRRQAVC